MHKFSASQASHNDKKCWRTKKQKGDLGCCIKCSIAKGALRHGVKIVTIKKLSDLCRQRYGKFKLFERRVLDSETRRYCSKCRALHSEEHWNSHSKCQQVTSSKRAVFQANGPVWGLHIWRQGHNVRFLRRCVGCRVSEPEVTLTSHYC